MDASAFIAIIAGEEGNAALADALQADPDRLCSAMSIWETVAGLCRSFKFSVAAACEHTEYFRHEGGFRFVVIGERELLLATGAYAQYGKGRHPAGLNMGDCFAYACAKANNALLLYKGDDFAKTDLA